MSWLPMMGDVAVRCRLEIAWSRVLDGFGYLGGRVSPVGDVRVFSWITDQELTAGTVSDVMRGGRASGRSRTRRSTR